MDTSKMLIPPSMATMKKMTTYCWFFSGSDSASSGPADECIRLLGDRFGYNSEKPFNNPPFLKCIVTKGDGSSEQPQSS